MLEYIGLQSLLEHPLLKALHIQIVVLGLGGGGGVG